jgi:hypothetical protein
MMAPAPLVGPIAGLCMKTGLLIVLFAVLLLAATRTAAHKKSDDETGST